MHCLLRRACMELPPSPLRAEGGAAALGAQHHFEQLKRILGPTRRSFASFVDVARECNGANEWTLRQRGAKSREKAGTRSKESAEAGAIRQRGFIPLKSDGKD